MNERNKKVTLPSQPEVAQEQLGNKKTFRIGGTFTRPEEDSFLVLPGTKFVFLMRKYSLLWRIFIEYLLCT